MVLNVQNATNGYRDAELDFLLSVLPPAIQIIGACVGPRTFSGLLVAISALGLEEKPDSLRLLSDAERWMPSVAARFAPWLQREAVRFALRCVYAGVEALRR